MTYFRISTDDTKGVIKSYLGEGKITNDPYGMDGGIAVCEIPNLQNLMKFMCKNGFEHHVGMVRGHVAEFLKKPLAITWAGKFINTNKSKSYGFSS
jgi:L-fucose isomerase-like protein